MINKKWRGPRCLMMLGILAFQGLTSPAQSSSVVAMDETPEMPKLRNLMADDPHDWLEPESLTLDAVLRNAPHRPMVEIRVQVVFPDGRLVEHVRTESVELWDAYRTYYKTSLIRDTAEHVAARIAYAAETGDDEFI